MAQTYTERKRSLLSQARIAKRYLRSLETAVNKVERKLVAIISRKTMIEPDSLLKINDAVNVMTLQRKYFDTAMAQLYTLANNTV